MRPATISGDSWRDRARCGGLARTMDPPGQKVTARHRDEAVAICLGCPVLVECRAWVLSESTATDPGGVCGGLSETDRVRHRVTAKKCPRCRRVLPGTRFYVNSNHADGLQTYCMDCQRNEGNRT